MKIAITADAAIPVPPHLYGGIERMIDLLVREFSSAGHHVTLFAHKDSTTPCDLVPYKVTGNSTKDVIINTLTINKTLLTNKFDLIHSFGRLACLSPQLWSRTPKLMSYQRQPTLGQIKKAVKLFRNRSLVFTGCSNYITDQIRPLATAYTVYNGVDMGKYPLSATVPAEAPLVFLGRIEPIKGTHTAVEIALKAGKNLIIAGNVPDDYQPYFNEKIKPFLGGQIRYAGPVDDVQKAALLRSASALLMPIHWDEPFGIVMIEAMACGTPVLGFNRGAVPEIIEHAQTGFIASGIDELVQYISLVPSIVRANVHERARRKFSSKVIAHSYLEIYKELLDDRQTFQKK